MITKRKLVSLLLLSYLSITTVLADSVTDMCLIAKVPENICECATDKLKESIDKEVFELYERVGEKYLEGLESGVSNSDAWDAAGNDVATEMGTSYFAILPKTNEAGKAHNTAMKACM